MKGNQMDTFADLHRAGRRYEARTQAEMQQLQQTFNALCEAARPKSKRRKPADGTEIDRSVFEARAEALISERRAALAALEFGLRAAAMREVLPRTEKLEQRDIERGGSYHTQGFGANKYAEAAAQQKADKAVLHGLKAEVRAIKEEHVPDHFMRSSVTYVDYGVFADTTLLGWEMLQRRPEVPLREWVRLCWKRGVNPRVYYPFLPHGYEEKAGLDFFGGPEADGSSPRSGR